MSSNLEFSGELPLFPSGWGSGSLSYTGGEAFWAEIERITSAGGFGDSLDGAMLSKVAPRVWLFLHEPAQGTLSVSAAMGFARHLIGRGQAVLVLDGDDDDSELTRWSGRENEEGWLDLVRYGVSLQAAGIPLPFGGRASYLLGVGSFTPTDVTDVEIERILTRLKRQADDIIIVAPTNVMGYKWAKVADLRLLCWDRAKHNEGFIDGVAGDFAGIDCPLTSLVGFGFPDKNTPRHMDGRADLTFEKTEERPSDPVEEPFNGSEAENSLEVTDSESFVPPSSLDRDDTEDFEKDFEEISKEYISRSDEREMESNGLPVYGPEAGLGRDNSEQWDREKAAKDATTRSVPWTRSSEDGEYATRKGSSKVFWFFTAGSLVVIALASIFFFQFIRIPPEGNFAPVEEATTVASVNSGNLDKESEIPPESGKVVFKDEDMVPVSVRKEDPGSVLEEKSQGIAEKEAAKVAEKSVEQPVQESGEAKVIIPADPAPQKKPAVAAKVNRTKGFQMDPYLIPVGQEGYALHIYSFKHKTDALDMMRELELKGFQTDWREVQLPKKGRYFRIFLGSFSSKSSARAAKGPLLKKLRQDWGRVARF